jgi:sulfatase-modifying factor enzyme 1
MNGSSSCLRVVPGLSLIAMFTIPPLGCWSSSGRGGGPGSGPRPEVVSIESRTLQSGFATGLLRKSQAMSSYGITKYPVTWADFNACVRSGACGSPDSSACGEAIHGAFGRVSTSADAVPQQPATCVGEKQAEAYCHWVGGRLPTLDEWLLAARGEAPRRYAWGDAPPTCKEHPMGAPPHPEAPAALVRTPVACGAGGAHDPTLNVHQHPEGMSPTGVEDVLLAPGELLAPDPTAMFNACSNKGGHCIVFGREPAAIDGVQPFYQSTTRKSPSGADGLVLAGHVYAFRCAFGGIQGSGQ